MRTIYPISGSGFGGSIDVVNSIPVGATWSVLYNDVQIEFQTTDYIEFLRSIQTQPMAVVSMIIIPASISQATQQITYTSGDLLGESKTLQISMAQEASAKLRNYLFVKMPENIVKIGNQETFLNIGIAPNEDLTVLFNYKTISDAEIETIGYDETLENKSVETSDENIIQKVEKKTLCKNKILCFLIIFALIYLTKKILE